MHFRSLALVVFASGCALVDASGKEHGPGAANSYKDPISLPASANPRSAAIAELDGAPGPDVAVVREDGSVQFFLQMGVTGQFQMVPPPQGLAGYTTILSANLDMDDGFSELVAAGPGKLDVIVHDVGQPDMLRKISLVVPSGFMPRAIAASGVDPASSLLVAADATSRQVFVFRNPLGAPSPMIFMADDIANDVAIADVDASMPGPEVIVSHANHITTVSASLARFDKDLVPGTQARFLALGDFGGGPAPDVAYQALSQGPGEIGFMFGSPSGLVPQTTFTGQGTAGDALLGADVDGDGVSDLVSVFTETSSGKRMLEFFVRDPGNPMPLQFRESTLTVQARALTIATGDLNLDGRADFVLVPARLNGVDVIESN